MTNFVLLGLSEEMYDDNYQRIDDIDLSFNVAK